MQHHLDAFFLEGVLQFNRAVKRVDGDSNQPIGVVVVLVVHIAERLLGVLLLVLVLEDTESHVKDLGVVEHDETAVRPRLQMEAHIGS